MDARDVVTTLTGRLGDVEPTDAPGALGTFFAFAAETVSYEDGSISVDVVNLGTSIVESVAHWYPEDTRPELGSVLLTASRDIGIADTRGDQLDEAQALCNIVFSPSAAQSIERHLDVQGPAASDDAEYDFPTLQAMQASVLATLRPLLEHPAVQIFADGHAPMTPTEASLATPGREPVRLVGDRGRHDAGFAPDDFDRQFHGRKLGRRGSWDTARAVDLLVEFCARPLDHGAYSVTRDDAVVDFIQPFEAGAGQHAELRLEREIELLGPDGDAHHDRIGCTLTYAPTPDINALPEWHSIRAPARHAQTHEEPHDAPSLDRLAPLLRASPIGALLDRQADGHEPAATI